MYIYWNHSLNSSVAGNEIVQDNTEQVVDDEAEDLENPDVAANELLEEIGDCEDEVLDYIRRDLESTIIVFADSMKVNFLKSVFILKIMMSYDFEWSKSHE